MLISSIELPKICSLANASLAKLLIALASREPEIDEAWRVVGWTEILALIVAVIIPARLIRNVHSDRQLLSTDCFPYARRQDGLPQTKRARGSKRDSKTFEWASFPLSGFSFEKLLCVSA